MKYYAMNDKGQVMGMANYPDEAAQFIERIADTGKPTTWTPTGMQITVPEGKPTGWRIMKEKA